MELKAEKYGSKGYGLGTPCHHCGRKQEIAEKKSSWASALTRPPLGGFFKGSSQRPLLSLSLAPLGVLCRFLFNSEGIYSPKGLNMLKNMVMPERVVCQFNLNQFDKSDTLSGQQPTAQPHKASLVRFSALLFLLQVITSDQETDCKRVKFCWQHKTGEKQELQLERQRKCNMMCFPL